MFALWALITSCSRIGIDWSSMDWDRGLPPSSSEAIPTWVIREPLTLTLTDRTPQL